MRILSEKEVRALLEIEELVSVLEKAHVEFSTGKVVMPVRLVVPLPQIKGRITSMPAYLGEANALGIKIISYFQENPKQGLPAILATISLYGTDTGKPLVVMDGAYITAVRTACASAMATKALANEKTPVLGVVGAGIQARTHIRALSKVRQIERVLIYSPSGRSAPLVKQELEGEIGIDITVVDSVEAAVREADLIATVSTAPDPILNGAWLKPGVHINAVGSHRPDLREIDPATIKRSSVFVDSREAIQSECGDILLAIKDGVITMEHVRAEIGEVLAGAKQGRSRPDEITMYKSVGIAVQDVATAQLVYQRALERNVGTEVEL